MNLLAETIMKLLIFAEENTVEIYKLDVNPLSVLEVEVVAADGLLRISQVKELAGS